MDKISIKGQNKLNGEVVISGSKNSALAIISATILANGICRIENVPDISDVRVILDILVKLGAQVTYETNNILVINTINIKSYTVPYDMVKSIRASYYLIGALLGRFGEAEVELPGGCDFGYRPIDQHIKGFEALGTDIVIEHGLIRAKAEKLIGDKIYFDVVSVGATVNVMLAAVAAEGVTILENVAKEPHVVDLANFLNAMGANVRGAGTDIIKIKGIGKLQNNVNHTIIPDQIEAGTFMVAAAATRGDVIVRNIIPKHMESLSAKLAEMNVNIEVGDDYVHVIGNGAMRKANIKTLPYPGFPTDLHPQMAVLLSLCDGASAITEGIWDLRFQYVEELNRMGAHITTEGVTAFIKGPCSFIGTGVNTTDLRAGAALVIAGLVAEGETGVDRVNLIDRGYESFVNKLRNLGANIKRV